MENARHRLLVAHDENMADLLVRNDCLKRAEVDVVLRELYFAYTTPFFRRGPSVELVEDYKHAAKLHWLFKKVAPQVRHPSMLRLYHVVSALSRTSPRYVDLVGDVVRLTPVGRSFARVSLADDEEARPLYEYWTYNERWAVMKAEHRLLEGGATPMPTGSAIFRAAAGVAKSGQPVTVDSILEAIAEAEEEASADEVVNNGDFVDDSALVLGSTSDEVEEAEVEALEADEVANHGGFIDDSSLPDDGTAHLALGASLGEVDTLSEAVHRLGPHHGAPAGGILPDTPPASQGSSSILVSSDDSFVVSG